MIISAHLSAGLVSLALLTAPNTERADCSNAGNRYTAAVTKVISAAQAYEKCVLASNKQDECAAEMQALDDAHDDFVDALADAKACR